LIYPNIFPAISAIANYGNVITSTLLNLNVWLLIPVFTAMALLMFYMIDRAGMQRKEKIN